MCKTLHPTSVLTRCKTQDSGKTFQRDNAKLHAASITTAQPHNRGVWMLDRPECNPDVLPIGKTFAVSLNTKYNIENPRLLS